MTSLSAVLHGPPTPSGAGTKAESTFQPLNLRDLNSQLHKRKEKNTSGKVLLFLTASDYRWHLTSAHFPSARMKAMISPRGMGSDDMFSSVQFSSVTQLCLTLCDPMNRSTPGLPVHHQLTESTQTYAHRVGDAIHHLILCHPLLLLPPIPPSIRVFSNKSILHMRWPKYWSFSFSISPSNEHLGLIFFRMDWLDLLVVQGTLKSLF